MKPQQFPLNPCDYLMFSFRRMLEARGRTGGFTMIVLETEGEISPDRLCAALSRAMHVHPITKARICTSGWRGRPVWEVQAGSEDFAREAFTFEDLRGAADWVDKMLTLSHERRAMPPDFDRGPQVYLDFYAGPEGRGRVCLRWPHELMDAEGARWFLAELARLDTDPSDELPAGLRPDGEIIDLLAQRSILDRLCLFWRAVRAMGGLENFAYGDSRPILPVVGNDLRLRSRVFEHDEMSRIQANAREICPRGPALAARYLAGCVMRSWHRLSVARGLDMPGYGMALPLTVRPPGPRPVPGNYIVSVLLQGRRERVEDARMLAKDLHQQVTEFLQGEMAQANWAVARAMQGVPPSSYGKLLQSFRKKNPALVKFSYLGDIRPAIRRFLGARVTNMWATTAVAVPPGWFPVFFRFHDRLNFLLIWVRGYMQDSLLEELATMIEREIICGPDSSV